MLRQAVKAFTLIEVVVALGILAVILSFAGVIFRVSVDSQRMAMANAEIMQNLRVITEQLDADFRGLCKEGEILVFWRAARKPNFIGANRNDPAAFDRYDTIMFFATGDFSTTYDPNFQRSNVARICYTLANTWSAALSEPNRPVGQKASKRMLARTQHVLIARRPGDPNLADRVREFNLDLTDTDWRTWNSHDEADPVSIEEWLLLEDSLKADIISVIGDMEFPIAAGGTSTKYMKAGGVILNPTQPDSMRSLLCRGVGQFKVQGWNGTRWIPEVNPDGDADLTDDSDFFLQGNDLHPTGFLYLRFPQGPVRMRNQPSQVDQDLRNVPGLGRALKFTFTLYESRGLIRNGRTFTHIVTLDD